MRSADRGRYLLTNARIVAADRIIEGGSLAVEDGAIVALAPRPYPPGAGALDLGGRLLLPGLVDLHNDALEQEIAPRPGADFDPAFALLHLDRKLAAAGVTTEFHAVYFGERGSGRSVTFANALARAIGDLRASGHATIDHQVLHRLELRSPDTAAPLLAALDAAPLPYLSFNDHTPGQGQFNDLDAFRAWIRTLHPPETSEETIERVLAARLAEAAETEAAAIALARQIADEGRRRRAILSSHDDDTPGRVELMHGLGCTIAEFPVTLAAAQRAAELGMVVAMGAPNALRGGSLTGNIGARELIARGLVDVLIADYHAPSLLAAAFRLADLGLLDLPAAVRLVGERPARAVGLADRGTIAPGQRADLIAVDRPAGRPVVAATIVAGALAYAGGPFASAVAALAPTAAG